MALIKKPMTGMKDILPKEMQIRDYLIGIIMAMDNVLALFLLPLFGS